MSWYKCKHVKSAKFIRSSAGTYIDIILSENSKSISLFLGIIDLRVQSLSEIELEEVISILTNDKEARLKQRNFPAIYDKMLSDLINARKSLYGAEKEEINKEEVRTISKSELTFIIKQHFDYEDVEIVKLGADSPTIISYFNQGDERR